MYPLFVCPGTDIKEPIGSMADCFHFSAKNAAKEAKEIAKLGIPAVILFGLPRKKDPSGSEAWAENRPTSVCVPIRITATVDSSREAGLKTTKPVICWQKWPSLMPGLALIW
jgi:porphobilinogen synthase